MVKEVCEDGGDSDGEGVSEGRDVSGGENSDKVEWLILRSLERGFPTKGRLTTTENYHILQKFSSTKMYVFTQFTKVTKILK